jgi:8-oxo-dGTP pyrophosphatase MutT (NUDIX family)
MYEFRVTKEWPYHVSSGGAVYKVEDGVHKYAVLHRKPDSNKDKFETWHLPKGTLRSDETLEQGALREIREESGIDVEIEKYLGALHQTYFEEYPGWNVDRVIHYFLCKHVSGDGSLMDHEHDALLWCTVAEAIEKLKKHPKQENEIIERAEKYLAMEQSK